MRVNSSSGVAECYKSDYVKKPDTCTCVPKDSDK